MAELRSDARQKLTTMSRKIHLPISTIYDRIRYHQGKYIYKHSTLLNFEELGFQTRAHILFRVQKEDKEAFAETLQHSPWLNSIYKVNNGYDFLAECIFRNINELENFIEELEHKHKIKAREIFYIVKDLQREAFMSNPQSIDSIFNQQTNRFHTHFNN